MPQTQKLRGKRIDSTERLALSWSLGPSTHALGATGAQKPRSTNSERHEGRFPPENPSALQRLETAPPKLV